MLRWQVPDFFPFQRPASAARRRPAPARRPHRRPVPELADSGSDPQDNNKRTQLAYSRGPRPRHASGVMVAATLDCGQVEGVLCCELWCGKKKNSLPPVNWRWVEEGDGYVGRLQPHGQPLGVGLPSGLQCLVPYPYRGVAVGGWHMAVGGIWQRVAHVWQQVAGSGR